MKNAMLKNAFAEIRKTKSRFLSIFGIIAIGTGFFAGLLSSEPDMKLSSDNYYDRANLMNYRLVSTFGFDENDIEAIEKTDGVTVYPGYFADAFVHTAGGDKVARIYSLDNIGENNAYNELRITEGRLPQNESECVIDNGKMVTGYNLGDKITLTGGEDSTIEDTLSVTEYTIVGRFETPMFISDTERGNTTIGNGSVHMLMYVPSENFKTEYYTQVFVTAEALKEYSCYSDEYEQKSDEIKEKLEQAAATRETERFAEIKEEGEEKIADSQKELDDKKQEAYDEIAENEQKLADSKATLDDAGKQLEEGKNKLENSKQELDDAKAKLDDSKQLLDDTKKQLDEGSAQLEDKKSELDKAAQTLADSKKQLDEGKAQLKDKKSELNSGKQQLDSAKQKLDDSKALLDSKKSELDAAKQQLDDSNNRLNAAKQQLDDSKATLTASKAQLDYTSGELEKSEAELDAAYEQLENMVAQGLITEQDAEKSRAELDAKKSQLQAARAQYDAGVKQYEAGYAQYNKGLTDYNSGRAEYEAGLEQYNSGLAQYNAGKAEIDNGYSEYEKQLEEYNKGLAQLQAAEDEINAGYAEYEKGYREYSAGLEQFTNAQNEIALGYQQYEDGLKSYKEGVKQYEDGLAQYESGVKELEEKTAEYEDGVKQYEDGAAELSKAKTEAETEFSKAQKKIDDAKKELAELDSPVWYVFDRDDNPGYSEYGQNAERIKNIALVFPIFFVLVAALVCLTTMTRMVDEQRTQIGTLKALGYSNGSIIFKYLLYALIAATAGALAGTLIGLKLFPAIIICAYGMMYKLPDVLLPYDPALMCLTILAAAALVAATVYFACKAVLSEQPATLMRPKTPKSGKKILLERLGFIWNHISFSHKVTMRNLFRYKRRMFMTVIGIAGCTALVLTGFGVYDSVNDIVQKQFDEISNYTAIVAHSDDMTDESRSEAEKILDSYGCTYGDIYQKQITASTDNGSSNAYIFAAESNDEIAKFVTIKDRKSNEKYAVTDDGVIINEKLATLLGGVKKGDVITVLLSETKQREVTVTDICENYAHHYIYMTENLYRQISGDDVPYNCIFVNSSDMQSFSADKENEIAEKLMSVDGVMAINFKTSTEGTFNNMLKSLNFVVLVLIISAGLLAFIVLYNLTNININERIREIATLKVLGFYDKEVSFYVFRETFLLTALGIGAGLLLGIALESFVVRTAEIDMVMFGREIHPLSFIMSIAITLIFAIIVTLVMHRHLQKVNMVEALKSVE